MLNVKIFPEDAVKHRFFTSKLTTDDNTAEAPNSIWESSFHFTPEEGVLLVDANFSHESSVDENNHSNAGASTVSESDDTESQLVDEAIIRNGWLQLFYNLLHLNLFLCR